MRHIVISEFGHWRVLDSETGKMLRRKYKTLVGAENTARKLNRKALGRKTNPR